ncbi:MAG TPA: hypothetical protein VFT98_05420, partial [Myxococcota bacterium]|nr:hypothetical protein [Myxococcota bacterium]
MRETARLMLAGKFDLIEGCRRIASHAALIGAENDPAILPLRGIDSETDDLPRGESRQHYAAEFLNELDRNAEKYLAVVRPPKASEMLSTFRITSPILRSFMALLLSAR